MPVGRLSATRERLRAALTGHDIIQDDVYDVPAMQQLYDGLEHAVCTNASVLISGESGCGKRLLAKTIHVQGQQSRGPLITLGHDSRRWAAFESEVAQQERDARAGVLAQAADGGTVVLEDIAALTPAGQAGLLRFLDSRNGLSRGRHELGSKPRLICLTSSDLIAAARARSFDPTLLARIGAVQLQVPPLRARGDDVLRIAAILIARLSEQTGKSVVGLAPDVADRLLAYAWPGNVEELQSTILHAFTSAEGRRITRNDLPFEVLRARSSPFGPVHHEAPTELAAAALDERYVLKVLEAVAGDRSDAASMLGIRGRTLRKKLRGYQRH